VCHFLSCPGSRFDPQHEDRQIQLGRKILEKKGFCTRIKLGKIMFKEHPNVTCRETETLELYPAYDTILIYNCLFTVRDLRRDTLKNTIYVIFTCSFLKLIYPCLIIYIQKKKIKQERKKPYFIQVT
jgi:hypothetical protein